MKRIFDCRFADCKALMKDIFIQPWVIECIVKDCACVYFMQYIYTDYGLHRILLAVWIAGLRMVIEVGVIYDLHTAGTRIRSR